MNETITVHSPSGISSIEYTPFFSAVVPNAVFSTASITNYTRNSGRVISKTFGLVYETDQDQLRQVLDQLSTYLDEHELVDSHRVKLIDLADFSLNIGTKITLQPEASREYFQFQEEFLFKSMEIVKSCGTSFAFPSQTVYVAGAIPKPQETG